LRTEVIFPVARHRCRVDPKARGDCAPTHARHERKLNLATEFGMTDRAAPSSFAVAHGIDPFKKNFLDNQAGRKSHVSRPPTTPSVAGRGKI
jgi:hypothetical protein